MKNSTHIFKATATALLLLGTALNTSYAAESPVTEILQAAPLSQGLQRGMNELMQYTDELETCMHAADNACTDEQTTAKFDNLLSGRTATIVEVDSAFDWTPIYEGIINRSQHFTSNDSNDIFSAAITVNSEFEIDRIDIRQQVILAGLYEIFRSADYGEPVSAVNLDETALLTWVKLKEFMDSDSVTIAVRASFYNAFDSNEVNGFAFLVDHLRTRNSAWRAAFKAIAHHHPERSDSYESSEEEILIVRNFDKSDINPEAAEVADNNNKFPDCGYPTLSKEWTFDDLAKPNVGTQQETTPVSYSPSPTRHTISPVPLHLGNQMPWEPKDLDFNFTVPNSKNLFRKEETPWQFGIGAEYMTSNYTDNFTVPVTSHPQIEEVLETPKIVIEEVEPDVTYVVPDDLSVSSFLDDKTADGKLLTSVRKRKVRKGGRRGPSRNIFSKSVNNDKNTAEKAETTDGRMTKSDVVVEPKTINPEIALAKSGFGNIFGNGVPMLKKTTPRTEKPTNTEVDQTDFRNVLNKSSLN